MQIRLNHLRGGMTVLEVAIALGLLAMGLALTAQVFTQCARQHLVGEQLLVAQWEAANVLEHLASLRYEEVTPEAVQAVQPSPQLQAALPEAKLHITVTNSAADNSTPANTAATNTAAGPPHKRIRVEVTWPAEEDSPHTVSLTAWKYPAASAVAKSGTEAVP